MTIERMPPEAVRALNAGADIGETIARSLPNSQTFSKGGHNLTPSWLPNPLVKHVLEVKEDGTGIYKMIPTYGGREAVSYLSGDDRDDVADVVIVNDFLENGRMGILDVIVYVPEVSSRK